MNISTEKNSRPIKQRFPGNPKGFTFVEVMIAIAVFSIGVLAIAAMQTHATNYNAGAYELTEASTLAETVVEEIMLADFEDDIVEDSDLDGDASDEDLNGDGIDDDDADGNSDDDDGDGDEGSFGLNDVTAATADWTLSSGQYTVFWNIADGVPVPNTPTSRTKTIRVVVTWPNTNDVSVSMDYVKADRF